MRGREFWMDFVRTYFMVVTMITLAMYGLGRYFLPEMRFGYEAFCVPLIYGAVGTIPNLVMYSRHELKIRELIVRKMLQLLLIEILVLFVAFYGSEGMWERKDIVVSMIISIVVIYFLSNAFAWLQDWIAAKRMTEELMEFQKSIQDE